MDPKNNQLNRNKHSVVSSDPKSNENYVVRQETSDKQGCFIVYKCANCSFSTDDKHKHTSWLLAGNLRRILTYIAFKFDV
ncbi:uncharacterized protein LOC141855998 isoform X2 [Brevipalpus obovatus]|uniref:uncharacterized protein LOC141855998 isoform X2 n=1 Tax=Brevipalpus obovatus TaxID=246614 RepID=UPI003D9E2130